MALLWEEVEERMKGCSLCLFRRLWKERNRRSFNEVKQSDQTTKSFFVCNFLDKARVYIDDSSMSMIGFVDWVGAF